MRVAAGRRGIYAAVARRRDPETVVDWLNAPNLVELWIVILWIDVLMCYLCPEGSTNIDGVITVGNKCIRQWGYNPAVRGNGTKFTCEFCGSTLNKSGKKRHQTNKCRSRRDTASDMSTSVGSDD